MHKLYMYINVNILHINSFRIIKLNNKNSLRSIKNIYSCLMTFYSLGNILRRSQSFFAKTERSSLFRYSNKRIKY